MGVEASLLAAYIASAGCIIASSIREGGSVPTWLRTAAAGLLGGHGSSLASRPSPGWVVCESGTSPYKHHSTEAQIAALQQVIMKCQ